jgi:hypothetical protein
MIPKQATWALSKKTQECRMQASIHIFLFLQAKNICILGVASMAAQL